MFCVWLSISDASAMIAEAGRMSPLETGGILVGYHTEGDIIITTIIGPGPRGEHGAHWFVPDQTYHEEEIARIYHSSGRMSTYLGDWHSHPKGRPRLSLRDRRTLRRIARTPDARAPQPLMLIVSGGAPWNITGHRARFAGPLLCVRSTAIVTYEA